MNKIWLSKLNHHVTPPNQHPLHVLLTLGYIIERYTFWQVIFGGTGASRVWKNIVGDDRLGPLHRNQKSLCSFSARVGGPIKGPNVCSGLGWKGE